MKKYIYIILLLSAIITVSGCIGSQNAGSEKVVNTTKNVSGFNQVILSGTGTLIITQGSTESLVIEAEDNVGPNITAEVNNNELILNQNNTPIPTKPVKYHLTVRDLNRIQIDGAGQIQSDTLNTNNLTIIINGAGQGTMNNLNAVLLNVIINGAGKLNMAGTATNQTIKISGAGNYSAANLSSRDTTINIDGGGNVVVKVSDLLNVVINGAGDISYIGNPQINRQITGGGNIKQIMG
ncbi:MAG TPA: head GIN domain-containing protein [Methanobacterium sp.]|nr:head GIN domain-containing protein [Methanobacterium sp.]